MTYTLAEGAAAIAVGEFLRPGQPHDRLHGCRILWVFQDDGLSESGFRVEKAPGLWRWRAGVDVVVRIASDVWAMCVAAEVTHQAVDHLLSHIIPDGEGGYRIRTPQLQALLSAVAQTA